VTVFSKGARSKETLNKQQKCKFTRVIKETNTKNSTSVINASL